MDRTWQHSNPLHLWFTYRKQTLQLVDPPVFLPIRSWGARQGISAMAGGGLLTCSILSRKHAFSSGLGYASSYVEPNFALYRAITVI